MYRIVIYIILGVFILSNSGCIKECTSSCLAEEINEIEMHHFDNKASIKEYLFQGQIVYYIDPGLYAFDQAYKVINSNCEIIAWLIGFAGVTEIDGVDFFKNARYLKTIWHA